jgi:hypothetical protein
VAGQQKRARRAFSRCGVEVIHYRNPRIPELGGVKTDMTQTNTQKRARRTGTRVVALTEPIARAIAQDAANRQMRKRCGRTREAHAWNADDYNLAAETLDRMWVQPLREEFEQRRLRGEVA